MNQQEFANGWHRLQGIYERMPDLSPALADEWFRLFCGFDTAVFDTAISDYIAHERYKPTPAILRRYCFEAKKRLQAEELAQRAALLKNCPHCGGKGVFMALKREKHAGAWTDTAFPCGCPASIDLAAGQMALQKALADPLWKWDEGCCAFVRLQDWIGDIEPKISAERMQQAFEDDSLLALLQEV